MNEVLYVMYLTFKEDPGGYIQYVFKNLTDGSYEMVTVLPNWERPILKVGEKGYLKLKEVIAGQDTWYDRATGQNILYLFDGVYYQDFVPEKPAVPETILL